MVQHREYDVLDFNIASTPSKYAEDVTFQMDDEDLGFFERIIADRVLPYKKISDVIRHAILRHREYVLSLMPLQKNGLPKFVMPTTIRERRRRLIEETHFGLVLDVITPVIASLSGRRQNEAAASIVEELLTHVLRMKSPRLREPYLTEIVRNWKRLLEITGRQDCLPKSISWAIPPKS
jgi:hypothetical protein